MTVVSCAGLSLLFFLFETPILDAFESNAVKGLLSFLVVGGVAEGFVRPLRAWNLRENNMPALACAKVSQSLGLVTCQLLLSFLGGIGLFLGDLVGRSLSATIHLLAAKRKDQMPVTPPKVVDIQSVAIRYRRYPLYSIWATAFIQLVDCGPLILLAFMYSSSIAGTYAMAHRVLLGPLLVVSMSITQVYIADCSKVVRNNPAELRKLFWQTSRRMALIGIVPISLLAGFGPLLVRLVLKEQWHDSGAYMALLAPTVF